MDKLFEKYIIDFKNGTIFSTKYKKFVGSKTKNGYIDLMAYDSYGNKYKTAHEIIYAEYYKLPKHLWPIDENGLRYEIDHENTIRDDNRICNLKLCSHADNMNNIITKTKTSQTLMGHVVTDEQRLKNSITSKGKHYSIATEFKKGMEPLNAMKVDQINQITGEVIKRYKSMTETEQFGFSRKSVSLHCKNGKPYKEYIWQNHS